MNIIYLFFLAMVVSGLFCNDHGSCGAADTTKVLYDLYTEFADALFSGDSQKALTMIKEGRIDVHCNLVELFSPTVYSLQFGYQCRLVTPLFAVVGCVGTFRSLEDFFDVIEALLDAGSGDEIDIVVHGRRFLHIRDWLNFFIIRAKQGAEAVARYSDLFPMHCLVQAVPIATLVFAEIIELIDDRLEK